MISLPNLEPRISGYKNIAQHPFFRGIDTVLNGNIMKYLERVHEMYYIIRDPETPIYLGLIGFVGIAWVINPADLDFLPLLGWIDDIVVFETTNMIVRWAAPPEAIERAEQKSAADSAGDIVSQAKDVVNRG